VNLELEVGKVAHGGVFVARHEGKVVFVEGALPGEQVRAELVSDEGRFLRARTLEVLSASEHRVPHFWKAADQGAGGAEFGHITLPYQRELKAQVLTEAMQRMAGVDVETEVQPMSNDEARGGLHYRTRVQLNVDERGTAGPVRVRSNEIIFSAKLPLAAPEIEELGLHLKNWSGVKKISIATSSTGDVQYLVDDKLHGSERLVERVGGRTFRLSSGGFWQVHDQAAGVLSEQVLAYVDQLGHSESGKVLDLYSGAGLFAAQIAQRGVAVTAVESNAKAVSDGERSSRDLSNLSFEKSDVLRFLKAAKPEYETVVLDPPRSGAAGKVIAALTALQPKNIIYVACDPVALARDAGSLFAAGYQMRGLASFDIFPHTHHFECVMALSRE
jgi:tRNA/tmRNA/rRNA uracil-C5-methylase (TrmA/RlmC/RlmD family)